MPLPRNAISNVTYNDGDLVWQMLALTDFTNCTFKGTAKNCNFASSTFTNCTFDPAFTMEHCNVGGTTGLPEQFAPLPAPEMPMGGGRPGAPGVGGPSVMMGRMSGMRGLGGGRRIP